MQPAVLSSQLKPEVCHTPAHRGRGCGGLPSFFIFFARACTGTWPCFIRTSILQIAMFKHARGGAVWSYVRKSPFFLLLVCGVVLLRLSHTADASGRGTSAHIASAGRPTLNNSSSASSSSSSSSKLARRGCTQRRFSCTQRLGRSWRTAWCRSRGDDCCHLFSLLLFWFV